MRLFKPNALPGITKRLIICFKVSHQVESIEAVHNYN
jgi:hypothetical protein